MILIECVTKLSFMQSADYENVIDLFHQPLRDALEHTRHVRRIAKLDDLQYLKCGVDRVLDASLSGREWVQKAAGVFNAPITVSSYFFALNSPRRLELITDVDAWIRNRADQRPGKADPLAEHNELKDYAVFATDGHEHAASAHESPIQGVKRGRAHILSLNLRSHSLQRLGSCVPTAGKKKKHEITALGELPGAAMRMGQPKATKVIHVYDPAILCYDLWHRWKQGHGVYIITLEKTNSALQLQGDLDFDCCDPRNAGVISDQLVGSQISASMLRRICYQDPASGLFYYFLTNERTLPPGLIAWLYRLRWDIEKVFDETKNKLGQKKAWGKSEFTKTQHLLFMCMCHNMLLLFEQYLKNEHGIQDLKSLSKQIQQKKKEILEARQNQRTPNPLYCQVLRCTQRSQQFLRWLRNEWYRPRPLRVAIAALKPLMIAYLN